MVRRPARHLQQHFVAYVALFVALGGTAYATSQIDGANLKNRSVSGAKLKDNTVTGKQIRESGVAQVPRAGQSLGAQHANRATNADKLDNLDSSAFARSTSIASTGGTVEVPYPTNPPKSLLTAGPFEFLARCGTNGAQKAASIAVKTSQAATADSANDKNGFGSLGSIAISTSNANGTEIIKSNAQTFTGGIPFSVASEPSTGSNGFAVHGIAALQGRPSDCFVGLVVFR